MANLPLIAQLVLAVLFSRVWGSNHCSSSHGHVLNVTEIEGEIDMTFQEGYAEEATCEWLLRAPSTHYIIELSIVELDTECSWDRLYLYDGSSFRDKLLGVYSGHLRPRPVYATSGAMLVYFFSDFSGSKFKGFKLKYSLVGTNRDGITPLGIVGTCRVNADCNYNGNTCDRVTSRCRCRNEYKGVYCSGLRTDWRLDSVGEPAVSRAGHKAVAISDTLYIFGGYDFTHDNSSAQLYRSVNMVNFGVESASNSPLGRYSHQMVAQEEGLPLYLDYGVSSSTENFGEEALFVHGGVFTNGTITDQLLTYHIQSRVWSVLPASPLAVADHVMVIVDNRWLFIHGGRTEAYDDNPIGEMYRYDIKKQTWSSIQYQQGYEPTLRLAGHTAELDGYTIYIYGGHTHRNARFLNVQSVLWKYNIKESIWSQVKDTKMSTQPPALVFHSSALYNNRLYVYGGRTSSTSSSLQCPNSLVYVFDISCQQWFHSSGSYDVRADLKRDLGQMGHEMVIIEHIGSPRLYVYGGVQGSLTSDVISIDIANIHVRAGHATCDPCVSQSTCHACVLTSNCHWCAAERKCRPVMDGECESIRWDDNSPITNISTCVSGNKPAGWYYSVYHHPVNYSQPDEIHLSTSSKIVWFLDRHDYVCPNCSSALLVRGYLYNPPPDNPWFMVIGNRAILYRVDSNGNENVVKSLAYSLSSSRQEVPWSEITFGQEGGYMMYHAYQNPLKDQNNIPATVGLTNSHSSEGFLFTNLQPYMAGDCSSYTNCQLCAADWSCGWCASQSQCLSIASSNCNGTSEWLLADPLYCESCSSFTNCMTCTESRAHCEWLPDKHICNRRGARQQAFTSPQQCRISCSQRRDCTSCLNAVDECIWCSSLSRCLPMDEYHLDYHYGECVHYESSSGQAYSDNGGMCTNCSRFTNCSDCFHGFFCGWCSHDANPIKGVCIPGDFSGPNHGQACAQDIQSVHGVVGEATWSFRKCPDLLECQLDTHDCVENADCIETLESYECKCKRGYTGIGNENCEKTCYNECVNGTCVPPSTADGEFRCECDLGYTGDDCGTDCQCNYHSTCRDAPGRCDECQHNTTGARCDKCVANSYGDARQRAGCTPCQCNGHGHPRGACDSSTGICNCVHMTTGSDCSQCIAGYYGDPRNGGECFRCYYGRSLIAPLSAADNFGSRYCHTGVPGLSASRSFLWQFSLSSFDHSSLHIQLVSLSSHNPVYIYDRQVDSLLSEQVPLAVLTNKDVGISLSSTGYLSVVYFTGSYGNGDDVRFKVAQLQCPDKCIGEGRFCDGSKCVCKPGYAGIDCEMLNCVPVGNGTNCGVLTDRAIAHRSKPALGQNDLYMYIQGGITPSGLLLRDLIVVDLVTSSVSTVGVSGDVPSARYGHSMVCTSSTCYLYGGVTHNSTGSSPLHQYQGDRGAPLYISSEFFQLSLSGYVWTSLENKVVPALTGHTLTCIACSSQIDMVLVGGMTDEVIWNPHVYRYSNSRWSLMDTSGARPKGLVGHSAVYRPEVNALYVIPGYEPVGSKPNQQGLYILELGEARWSKRIYDNFVPRAGSYLFAVSPRYLAMIGGFSTTDNDSMDSSAHRPSLHVDSSANRPSFRVYDTSCDSWHIWWAPTSIAGNVEIKSVVGYGYKPSSSEGRLLVVTSDESHSLVSSVSIPTNLCAPDQDHKLIHLNGESCEQGKQAEICRRSLDCEAIHTCDVCMSRLPNSNVSSQCVWSIKLGRCVKQSEEADKPAECPIDICHIHSSCRSCTRASRCHWVTEIGHMQYASCLSPTQAISSSVTSPDSCPIRPPADTCQSCLTPNSWTSPVTFTHTSARYLWNLNNNYCLVTDLAAILDASHLGSTVQVSTSCPQRCSELTHCLACHSQPHCGWCSVVENSNGTGLCMEGTRLSNSQCTVDGVRPSLRIDVQAVKWNFDECPLEDECASKYHTCDHEMQHCVDQIVGFKCECKEGFVPLSLASALQQGSLCDGLASLPAVTDNSEAMCVPTCEPGCGENGCCQENNTCRCHLGYVGDHCEQRCNCNGHSDCDESDLNVCFNCQHNTTGANCENCLEGYIGDPTSGEDCISCYHTCNERSNSCVRRGEPSQSDDQGSMTAKEVHCLNCSGNSEGKTCQQCKAGYFSQENNTCAPCMCNGHGLDGNCNAETGSDCECMNNTKSSSSNFRTQCDSCKQDYSGSPTNNHQCYRIVNLEHPMCLDPRSSSDCLPLGQGQAAYYMLNILSYSDVDLPDIRLTFALSSGAADVYISNSAQAFVVTYDFSLNEYVVSVDQSAASTASLENSLNRSKRHWSDRDNRGYVEPPHLIDTLETDSASSYSSYHRFIPVGGKSDMRKAVVLKLNEVKYRAVVIFPKDAFDFHHEHFYIVVKSTAQSTRGSLRFTQHVSRIEIFVFINIFSSGLLLFLCSAAIFWKMRQLQLIRRMQAMREVELVAMADRPFSSKMMFMDMRDEFRGASSLPFNVVPLALEPIANTSAVVATTFMMLPGDETRPMKAAVASTLLTWRLSFPSAVKGKQRSRTPDAATENETAL